jgi:hypothetical protein
MKAITYISMRKGSRRVSALREAECTAGVYFSSPGATDAPAGGVGDADNVVTPGDGL